MALLRTVPVMDREAPPLKQLALVFRLGLGAQLSDGYSIFNSPEQLQANLKASNPNASAAELYNQYRQGFGSTNITTVLDPRRIEIGMRFKF